MSKSESLDIYAGFGSLVIFDVMSLDVLAERYQAKVIFKNLLTLEKQMKEAIVKSSGIVSGNLNTGVECFFGWKGEGAKGSNHAQQAFVCARKFQEINASLIKQAARDSNPVFVLRVGIHTAQFCIAREKGDYYHKGIIGPGVPITRSLKNSCPLNAVMYSPQTAEQLDLEGINPKAIREVKVAKSGDAILAYAFNPFGDAPEISQLTTEAILKCDSRFKENKRWTSSFLEEIILRTTKGEATFINVSRSGMAIRMKKKVDEGDIVTVGIGAINPELEARLRPYQVEVVNGLVLWVEKKETFYLVGISYLDLSEKQKEKLLHAFFDVFKLSDHR